MDTFSPPRPAIDLSARPFYRRLYTITGLLPPPLAETPAACADQRIKEAGSENGTNSQDAAFETMLSEQPWNREGSGEPDLSQVVREAKAKSPSVGHCLRTGTKVPERRTMVVIGTNSHNTAFETMLRGQPLGRIE